MLQLAGGLRVGGKVLYGLGEVEDAVRHFLQLGEQLGSLVLSDVVEEDHQLVLHAGGVLAVGPHEPAQRQWPKWTPHKVHDRSYRHRRLSPFSFGRGYVLASALNAGLPSKA